jgi:hypothetical protein
LPGGTGGTIGWVALGIAAAVLWALARSKFELHWILAVAALAGLAASTLGWA